MMDALALLARFPLYSTAERTYQVRTSLVLPPPSTLIGALARGLAYLRNDSGSSLDELAKKLVNAVKSKLVMVSARPWDSAVVRNPFLLSRLRTLEPGKGKDTENKDTKNSDALVREYMFSRELLIIFIFRDLDEGEKDELKKAAFLLNSLGDTESIGSVIDVQWLPILTKRTRLNTYVSLGSCTLSMLKGSYMIQPMLKEPSFGEDRRERFVLPLREMRDPKTRSVYYTVSELGEVDSCVEFRGSEVGILLP